MADQNGSNFFLEVYGVDAGDIGPVFLLLELIYNFTGLPDGDALEVEFLDLMPENVLQLIMEALGKCIGLVCCVLQNSGHSTSRKFSRVMTVVASGFL